MKLIPFIATTIALSTVLTTSAFADAKLTATYKASADELWKLVEFHQPSENIMPPVVSSEVIGKGVGARKVSKFDGGGALDIQLVYIDAEKKAFNYVVRSGPAPVKNYVGEVRVKDLGGGRSELSWHGIFEPDGVKQAKADEAVQGFYDAIFGKIGEKFSRE